MEILMGLSLLALCHSVTSATASRPHIIFILVDDLGWHDVGYHGNDQIKTPNIDALAYSGTVLSRHYVFPSCTPSRAALLTGYHAIRTGMQGYPLRGGEDRNLPLSFKLQPSYFKELGYKTHMIGKWHLGYQTYNHVPNNRGFDTFFGYYNGYIDFFLYNYRQPLNTFEELEFEGYDLHYNDEVHWSKPEYATTLFTKRAQQVIREHNPSEPLYLFFSHLAMHTGNDTTGMQVPTEADVNRTYRHIKYEGRRAMAGCLEELDESVGVVMEELKNKGMLEKSIVVFMSDNGAHTVSVDMAPNWSSNWPLAGSKFTMYEGGVRGAALIWSPLLPKGFVNQGFMHITDWLPTLYSAAGGNVNKLGSIDGIDQWEALKQVKTVKRDHLLININERTAAEGLLIDERWKIIKGGTPSYANYELHWGKEENVEPNPAYNFDAVANSKAGKVVHSMEMYKNVFEHGRMRNLRGKSMVNCSGPEPDRNHKNGYVDKSSDFRCRDYCVFDIVSDPCETTPVDNEAILGFGKELLEEYRRKVIPQKNSSVNLRSNPEFFGGVWMPWDDQGCATSVAEEFTGQFRCISLILTISWYFLRKNHNTS